MKTWHFIGLGGIGMSGIARLRLELGDKVQGSDVKKGHILEDLEKHGAKVFLGHSAAFVKGADRVVYSSAIPADHPERQEAHRLGIPVRHRAEALAELCEGKFTIAVSGTHGKTTTTSMIATVLKETGQDPGVVVGGWVEGLGGNARLGGGELFVIEADESDSSFLKFSPNIAVVTNIEPEHLDHFNSVEAIEDAYERFLRGSQSPALWFGCAQDERVRRLSERIPGSRLYGFSEPAVFRATDVVECAGGRRGVSFTVHEGIERLGEVTLSVPGKHNVLNALAALGVACELGIPFPQAAAALSHFGGARRRFDVKYEDKDYLVVDDYAHHPTEIQSTLAAAKSLGRGRIVALFQPHRFSRTESLMNEFGGCFAIADKLILTDIYAASETPRPGVTGRALLETVRGAGHPDAAFVRRDGLTDAARRQIRRGDLVLVMGAGDVSQVASQLSECLKKNGDFSGIFRSVKGKVLREEPLSRHTTLKVGGPAEFWAEPEDEEDLKRMLEVARTYGLDVRVFGGGSNVLPPDEGVRGLVLHLGSPYFRKIWQESGCLLARAGAPHSLFIQAALERGFGGFEFLFGIPGHIGGIVAMNAGSHGQAIAPFLETVRTMDLDGGVHTRPASTIRFGYRCSEIGRQIVLEASFRFPRASRPEVQKKLDEYREYRLRTQDLQHPSAGCMFKNPDIPGCSAGRLIEEAGLKGLTLGGAQVSPKHANFIVNLGGATAQDVRTLIERVRAAVKENSGRELEPEVKILE